MQRIEYNLLFTKHVAYGGFPSPDVGNPEEQVHVVEYNGAANGDESNEQEYTL